MFAFAHVMAQQFHIEHRARLESHFQPIGELAIILLDNTNRDVLYNLRREHLQHEHGDAHGKYSKNHPQNKFVAEINLPNCL